MFVDLKRQYRKSLKSMDTEETIDLAFYRPIGFAWAYLFRKLGITPNVVTIASIFLGVGAGICFYFPKLGINCVGMFLLIWANSYDSADGQLARLTGNYSRLGRILDGLSGDLWFITIYIAICLREVDFSLWFGQYPWVIWSLGVVAGICHAKQAAAADYYRQFHLLMVRGKDAAELDNAGDLLASVKKLPWHHNFWKKITQSAYLRYTMRQESMTPQMQRLRAKMHQIWPDGEIPPQFAREFRQKSLPLMKFTNVLTFNWRTIVLFITLFLGQPWIYFVIEITVFTAIMIYMVNRHENICRKFADTL